MRTYSIISFINGLIVASGIVIALLLYYSLMPIARIMKSIQGVTGLQISSLTEGQILVVFYLGITASAIALSYEVYRWTKGRGKHINF